MSKSVVIITPTTGAIELKQCMESVALQDFPNLRHLIVVDGHEANQSFVNHSGETTISYIQGAQNVIDYIILPTNVGADGWYGHRVFAAMPYLVNEDVVMFLDQDNWLEPNHIETMMNTLDKGADWAYSLRNICEKDGNFLCHDNCENLGKWPAWPVYVQGETYFHIDTNCYAVPREILVRGVCGAWYGKWGQDRKFFSILKQHFPNFECTGKHTLNYRLAGNEGSVKPEFFIEGNRVMKETYKNHLRFPWENDV